jgi:uncharacterized membrane-anchored protein YitT (DUF2179 family)
MSKKKTTGLKILGQIMRYFILTMGAFLVASALELFLAPNGLIDGGVTGLSIMAEEEFGIPLAFVFAGLNIPILIFTARTLGQTFFIRSLYALIMTLVFLATLPFHHAITDSDVLIVLYGGIILGLGIGLVIRVGGAIDGVEMLAVWLNEKYQMSVGTTILVGNLIVILISAIVFSIESAMLSFVVFVVVTKVIDIVEVGFEQHKSLMVISSKNEEIAKVLIEEMHLTVTMLEGRGGYSQQHQVVLYSIVNKFLYSKARDLIMSIDEDAIIEANTVSETNGLGKHELKDRVLKKLRMSA